MSASESQSLLPDDDDDDEAGIPLISTANTSTNSQKNWFIPADQNSYKTHIDHGCKIDEEGYPIYPNGNTTFVCEGGNKITNFGTVGFSKTIGVDYNKDWSWKTTQIYCLGVLCCDIDTCQCLGSPPTARHAIEAYFKK
jgi:hypothetical protein